MDTATKVPAAEIIYVTATYRLFDTSGLTDVNVKTILSLI